MKHNVILKEIRKIDDIEIEEINSEDTKYLIKGSVPLYSIDMVELNKWYTKWLKDLTKLDNYGTEYFETIYPEQIRGSALDAIENFILENLDLKDLLSSFSFYSDFKIVWSSTYLYSASVGFELEIADVAPF